MTSAARTINLTMYKDFYILQLKFYPATTSCSSIWVNWCIRTHPYIKPKLPQSENSYWLLIYSISENLSEDTCSFVCHCGDFSYCVDVGLSVSALPAAVLDQQEVLEKIPCQLNVQIFIMLSVIFSLKSGS